MNCYLEWDTDDLIAVLEGFQDEVDYAMLNGSIREDDEITLDSAQQAELLTYFAKHIALIQEVLNKRGVATNAMN